MLAQHKTKMKIVSAILYYMALSFIEIIQVDQVYHSKGANNKREKNAYLYFIMILILTSKVHSPFNSIVYFFKKCIPLNFLLTIFMLIQMALSLLCTYSALDKISDVPRKNIPYISIGYIVITGMSSYLHIQILEEELDSHKESVFCVVPSIGYVLYDIIIRFLSKSSYESTYKIMNFTAVGLLVISQILNILCDYAQKNDTDDTKEKHANKWLLLLYSFFFLGGFDFYIALNYRFMENFYKGSYNEFLFFALTILVVYFLCAIFARNNDFNYSIIFGVISVCGMIFYILLLIFLNRSSQFQFIYTNFCFTVPMVLVMSLFKKYNPQIAINNSFIISLVHTFLLAVGMSLVFYLFEDKDYNDDKMKNITYGMSLGFLFVSFIILILMNKSNRNFKKSPSLNLIEEEINTEKLKEIDYLY